MPDTTTQNATDVAAIEADKRNTLAAMAAQGQAGVAAYDQAKAELAQQRQAGMAGAASDAALRGAPAGLGNDLAQEYNRWGTALGANAAQFAASRQAAQANVGAYFGAAEANVPSIRAFNQGKLDLAQNQWEGRVAGMREQHTQHMDDLKAASEDKAQLRQQQERMAQLGHDFEVRKIEAQIKALDGAAFKMAGVSSGTSDYAKEMHWQAEYNLKLRAADRADRAQSFNEANQTERTNITGRQAAVGNWARIQGVRNADQRLALAQAVAQDRSGLQHNAQSWQQNYQRAQLEISQGHLDLAQNSQQFNQALARARYITQGQQWSANQARMTSQFNQGQAATQGRFDTSQAGINSRFAQGQAGTQSRWAAGQANIDRRAANRPGNLTPTQQGQRDAERTQARDAALGKVGGTVATRRAKIYESIGFGPSSRRAFDGITGNQSGSSGAVNYETAMSRLAAERAAGHIVPKPKRGSGNLDYDWMKNALDRYYERV